MDASNPPTRLPWAAPASPISGPAVLVAETANGPRTFNLVPNPRVEFCAVLDDPAKPIALALYTGNLAHGHVELDPARAVEVGEALAAAGRARGSVALSSGEPWGEWAPPGSPE